MKNNWLNTSLQLAKNVKTTGALYQTSKKVEKEIGAKLSDQPNLTFVEFGLGHGNITRSTLARINPSSQLYSFEINKDFCNHVSANIDDERLEIINDGAQNLSKYINTPVDGIVSSIPITLFTKELQDEVFKAAYNSLKSGSYFSQILYTKKLNLFRPHFDEVSIRRLINLPLEYVHHCKKK